MGRNRFNPVVIEGRILKGGIRVNQVLWDAERPERRGQFKGENMKKIRLEGAESSWVIYMPNLLFWFFQRFARVRTAKRSKDLRGISCDIVFYDEWAEEVTK